MNSHLEGLPERVEALRPIIKGIDEIYHFIIRELAREQVKLLVGHDACDPGGIFDEMDLLEECGIPRREILRGATSYPAKWLGLDKRLGSVAPGKEASLLFLDKNPLEDIKNTRATYLVV